MVRKGPPEMAEERKIQKCEVGPRACTQSVYVPERGREEEEIRKEGREKRKKGQE